MGERRGRTARMPATKLPHLVKKQQKSLRTRPARTKRPGGGAGKSI